MTVSAAFSLRRWLSMDDGFAVSGVESRSPSYRIVVACPKTWAAAKRCNAWGAPAGSHGCRLDPGHNGPHVCACNRKAPS